ASSQALLVPELSPTPQDTEDFQAELRQRCLPILFWTTCMFAPIYVAWSGFDYVLAPEHFRYFLSLRLIVATFNTLLVAVVHHRALRRYVWEAFAIWAMVMAGSIALMLAIVDQDSYPKYVVGFILMTYGVGLLPNWPPRWTVSVIVPMIAMP